MAFLAFTRCAFGRFGGISFIGLWGVMNAPRSAASNRCCVSRLLYWSRSFAMVDQPQKPKTRLAQTEPPKKIRPSGQRKRLRTKVFKPLAIELGWLTFEWNRLHELLGEVFACVMAEDPVHSTFVATGLAAWHALTNERSQRDMLRAALDARYFRFDRSPRFTRKFPGYLKNLERFLAGETMHFMLRWCS